VLRTREQLRLFFSAGGEDHYSEATICGAPVCGEHRKSIDIWDTDRPALTKNGTWSAQLFAEVQKRCFLVHSSIERKLIILPRQARDKDRQSPQNNTPLEQAAQAVIHAHDSSAPLFLYFALHNTHGPTQAPQRLIDLYEGHDDCRTVGNLSDCASENRNASLFIP
jgi:hypothetical protein